MRLKLVEICILLLIIPGCSTLNVYRGDMALIGDKYQNNEQIVIGVVGTSVAQGFYADNYGLIVRDGNYQITWESSYDVRIQSWPVQLRAHLKTKNAASDIYNVSIGGGRLNEHIEYGNVALLASQTPKPDAIMIGCQINDAVGPGIWVSLEEYKRNLSTLLNQVRDEGIQPFMLIENDIDPARYTGPRTDGKTYLDFINAARQIARSAGVNILDLYEPFHAVIVAGGGAIASGYYHDQVHPNQLGTDLGYGNVVSWLGRLGSFTKQNPLF